MIDFATLKPSRKADRARASDILRDIARKFGFTTQAQENEYSLILRIQHSCGAAASIWIDRTSTPQEIVAWHTAPESGFTFPDSFGDVNPHHKRKATKVYPWELLPACLQSDCRKLAKGA